MDWVVSSRKEDVFFIKLQKYDRHKRTVTIPNLLKSIPFKPITITNQAIAFNFQLHSISYNIDPVVLNF